VKCSKNVNAPCQNEATEILCVRSLWGEWETYPRCAEHPAAWDIKMIKRFTPSAVTKILPADALPGLALLGDVLAAAVEVFGATTPDAEAGR